MLPNLSPFYHPYKPSRDAILLRDDMLEAGIGSDRHNIGAGQLCVAMPLAFGCLPQTGAVGHVIQTTTPIKIGQTVVLLIAVAMAYLLSALTFSKEGAGNKPMDIMVCLLSVFGELYRRVARWPKVLRDKLCRKNSAALRRVPYLPLLGAHITKVRDLILSFVTGNGCPTLHLGKLAGAPLRVKWKDYP